MFTGDLILATEESAGYDLKSQISCVIEPHKRMLIPTGVKLNLKPSTCAFIKSRSGLACKYIDVKAGVIDSDYSNEVKVLLSNESDDPFNVELNMRVAQLVVLPILRIEKTDVVEEKDHVGFGSTGLF